MSQPPLPAAQMRAAVACGRLTALGLVEGPPLLRAIYRAARAAAPNLDPMGLRMRLVHTARDAASATQMERNAAENAIWRALKPALEARANTSQLLAIAQDENKGEPPLLRPHEVRALIERAITVHLARMRRATAA